MVCFYRTGISFIIQIRLIQAYSNIFFGVFVFILD